MTGWQSPVQVFPVGAGSPPATLGAAAAWGATGCHGALPHRLLRNSSGSCQVTVASAANHTPSPPRPDIGQSVSSFVFQLHLPAEVLL